MIFDIDDLGMVKNSTWSLFKRKDYNLYYAMNRNGKLFHRVILNINDVKIMIDHKNHNGLDCRKCNLRIASNAQNQWNQRLRKDNTTGYKGVTYNKKNCYYSARIKINNKLLYLGSYSDKNDAAIAYNKKATELFGEFAFLNIIKNNPVLNRV
jgi:hypothetical protein